MHYTQHCNYFMSILGLPCGNVEGALGVRLEYVGGLLRVC